jgi:hypothetical protein
MYPRGQAETLTLAWFKDEQGKKQVAETLNESGFDEYAIEGEAIRRSPLPPQLEKLAPQNRRQRR